MHGLHFVGQGYIVIPGFSSPSKVDKRERQEGRKDADRCCFMGGSKLGPRKLRTPFSFFYLECVYICHDGFLYLHTRVMSNWSAQPATVIVRRRRLQELGRQRMLTTSLIKREEMKRIATFF